MWTSMGVKELWCISKKPLSSDQLSNFWLVMWTGMGVEELWWVIVSPKFLNNWKVLYILCSPFLRACLLLPVQQCAGLLLLENCCCPLLTSWILFCFWFHQPLLPQKKPCRKCSYWYIVLVYVWQQPRVFLRGQKWLWSIALYPGLPLYSLIAHNATEETSLLVFLFSLSPALL